MTNPAPFNDFDHRIYRLVARLARIVGRYYFRFELRGFERLPDGPCLVVGNHSGLGIVEEALLLGAWEARFGLERRAWGLVHDFLWEAPFSRTYYRRIGALPATRENAIAAFERGDVVLVFPGGDYESSRPFYQPRKVDFARRRGYAAVAQEAGVPIVPLATVGSHWTWTFLPGGVALAKLPGVRRLLRMDRVPLPSAALGIGLVLGATTFHLLSAWWLVAALIVAVLPTPVRISSELLPPVHLEDDEPSSTVDLRVRAALQEALDGSDR